MRSLLIGLMSASLLFCVQVQASHTLHVDPTVNECTIQLDPSLTQAAFSRFAREFAWIMNYKSQPQFADSSDDPWAVSLNVSVTPVDQHSAAWNDTFVHPDASHVLGDNVVMPMVTISRLINDRHHVGLFFVDDPNSNYNDLGLEYVMALGAAGLTDRKKNYLRFSFSQLLRTKDLQAYTLAAEMVRQAQFSQYNFTIGIGAMTSHMSERSTLVNLADEHHQALYGFLGIGRNIGPVIIAMQADVGTLSSVSLNTSYRF